MTPNKDESMKPKVSEWRKEWKFIVDETIEDMDGYVGKLPYEDEMFERMWKFGESFIQSLLDQQKQELVVTGETSDGYHTFNELYEFRKVFNAVLFSEWANGWNHGFAVKYDVHKSKKHNDGELCFGGGWFIVMAETPYGQISNHYELKDWDLFNIPEKELANKWDGHTAQDVVLRLKKIVLPDDIIKRLEGE